VGVVRDLFVREQPGVDDSQIRWDNSEKEKDDSDDFWYAQGVVNVEEVREDG
jgi:hypothetical protein